MLARPTPPAGVSDPRHPLLAARSPNRHTTARRVTRILIAFSAVPGEHASTPTHLTARPARPVPTLARRVDRRRPLARLGEDLAEAHLHELGFSTLARNERCREGEIDLIAFDGRTLVFAEVKTRLVGASGRAVRPDQEPLAWLRPRQLARVRRLAVGWLHDERRARPTARSIRFDAIGVIVDPSGRPVRIDHVEGAW